MMSKEKKYNSVRNCLIAWYGLDTIWAITILVAKLPHSQLIGVVVVFLLPIIIVVLGLAYAR